MSQHIYPTYYYGIPIPIDNSELYQHVLKKLISKHSQLYQECQKDELTFLTELQFTYVPYDAEDIGFISLDNEYEPFYNKKIFILFGDHEYPTLYSAPFKSKEDCVNYYKENFGDILPKDFNYENNIGKISYITWG